MSAEHGNRAKNLVGKRYGRLVVTARAANANGKSQWRCLCDCGSSAVRSGNLLTRGDVLSCGCLHKERASANMTQLHAAKRAGPPKQYGRPGRPKNVTKDATALAVAFGYPRGDKNA